MTPHYVHVIGPYDNTFIGPFADHESADDYIRTLDRNTFSAYVMTEWQFSANVQLYGAVAVESPEYIQ